MGLFLYDLQSFSFTYSEFRVGWLERAFSALCELVGSIHPPGHLRSVITKGIIQDVSGVLGFVPIIVFMFFGIAILEDSGYLARKSFKLDRVFRVLGRHGNSLMAFIVGGGIAGGCCVPGMMATRTLRSSRERLATILAVPLMNRGAKLPIYPLFAGAAHRLQASPHDPACH